MKTFLRKYRVLAIAFVFANLFLVSGAMGQTTYYLKTASQANANVVTNWNTDATGGGAGTNASAFTGATVFQFVTTLAFAWLAVFR